MNHTLLDIEKQTCEAFIDECENALVDKEMCECAREFVKQQMNITRDRLKVLNILMTDETTTNA